MGQEFRALRDWCYTCCTDHLPAAACPGPLLATDAERHGWRILVATPFGPEIYGVLIAPAAGGWRARIVTYPNILWVLPEGGTMKFFGQSPREVETVAAEFIKQHCVVRGLKIQKKLPDAESGAVNPEYDELVGLALEEGSSRRKVQCIPVRFGIGHVTNYGVTDNLSEGGMFVGTHDPLPEGSPIEIQFEVEGLRIPLKGEVLWVRQSPDGGRPPGMGVRLLRPPPRYIHYIRQKLKPPKDDTLPQERILTAAQAAADAAVPSGVGSDES